METRIISNFPMYSGIMRNVKIKNECNEVVKHVKKLEKLGSLSAHDKLELAKKYELLLMFACKGIYKKQSPVVIKKKIIFQLFDALKSGETEAGKIISHYCEKEKCIDALYLQGECYESGMGVEKSIFNAAKCYLRIVKYIHYPSYVQRSICWEEHLSPAETEQYKDLAIDKFLNLMKSDELSLIEKDDVINYCFWNSYDKTREIFGSRLDEILEENAKKNIKPSLDATDTLLNIGKKEEAFRMYKQLAEDGEVVALERLGKCYKDGIGTEKNCEESFLYYEKAKSCIQKVCNDYFAIVHLNEEEKTYFKKLISAQRNVNEALVDCYYYGIGTTVDYKKAIELMKYTVYSAPVFTPWYKEAPHRIRLLYAECFYYGHGVEKDYDKIIDEIFDDVYRFNGRNDSKLLLGKCYYMKGDYEMAFSYFDYASIDREMMPGLSEAKLWLADCYFYNPGNCCTGTMQERYNKAIALCEIAEKEGEPKAREKAERFKKEYSEMAVNTETPISVSASSCDESSSSLSCDSFDAQWNMARNYVRNNCPSYWSHTGMDIINNDTGLSEFQKELCQTLYRIWGD